MYIFCGERYQTHHRIGVFFWKAAEKSVFLLRVETKEGRRYLSLGQVYTLSKVAKSSLYLYSAKVPPNISSCVYPRIFSPNICSFTSSNTMPFVVLFDFYASQLNASLSELIKLFKKLLWNSEISVSRYGWFPIEKSCMNGASIL